MGSRLARYTASEQREFYEAEESVARAILYLTHRAFSLVPAFRKYLRSPVEFDYELAKRKALVFLRCAYDSRKRRKAVFKNPNLRRAVKEALASDDLDFFKSVGRVLSKEQVSANKFDDLAFAEGTKLENFLIMHWTWAGNIIKPLCFLSMKELECFCHMSGAAPSSTDEKAIHTTWRRLGLKRVKGFKYRGPGLNSVTKS